MSRTTRTVIAGLAIVVVALAIVGWFDARNDKSPADQAAAMMVNGKLAGKDREQFLASTIASCNVRAMRDARPDTSLARIDTVCKCVAAKEADSITQDQIAFLIANKTIPADLQATIKRQLDECEAAK